MEYKSGKMIDYRHPISSCPELSRIYRMVNYEETKDEKTCSQAQQVDKPPLK